MKKKDPKTVFENPFGNIFERVKAQGSDAVASPTLPVDPNLSGNGGPASTPIPTDPVTEDGTSITLVSDKTNGLEQDDSIKIDVEIETNEETASEFRIQIVYNPNKLELTNNTFVDTYFTEESSIEVDELSGDIIIQGKATSEARTINRSIAELNFDIVSSGIVNLTIEETGSLVKSETEENILKVVKGLELEVGDITDEPTITPEESPTETLAETSYTPKPTSGIKYIPKSALDTPADYVPVVFGSLLVAIGLWLSWNKKRKDDLF